MTKTFGKIKKENLLIKLAYLCALYVLISLVHYYFIDQEFLVFLVGFSIFFLGQIYFSIKLNQIAKKYDFLFEIKGDKLIAVEGMTVYEIKMQDITETVTDGYWLSMRKNIIKIQYQGALIRFFTSELSDTEKKDLMQQLNRMV